ncbi:MAG: hypothetical protein R8L53_07140 [Mariprofundales bacterium]
MNKTHTLLLGANLLLISAITVIPQAMANDSSETMQRHSQHIHGKLHGNAATTEQADTMTKMAKKEGMFLVKKEIDDYTVSFHVMIAKEAMQHGGTHNYMIKVEKNGVIAALQAVNSKVIHPNNKSESKMMMKMGDWYMAGYDLGHAGDHKIMVLFKTKDGKKHFGGVKYNAGK